MGGTESSQATARTGGARSFVIHQAGGLSSIEIGPGSEMHLIVGTVSNTHMT